MMLERLKEQHLQEVEELQNQLESKVSLQKIKYLRKFSSINNHIRNKQKEKPVLKLLS